MTAVIVADGIRIGFFIDKEHAQAAYSKHIVERKDIESSYIKDE